MKDRFALHFVRSGDPAGDDPAAGQEVMRAIARSSAVAVVGCFAASEAQAGECERGLRNHGFEGEVEWVSQGRPQDLERFGTLYHPAPGLERLAWRRLGL